MLTSNWLALINIILMLDIIVAFICLSVGIFILVKSSDYFVESAEKIGKYIGLPNFVLGAILVGIGTSLPELSSSLVAAINKHTEIIVGNVIGSNITNILLVLGAASLFAKRYKIKYNLLKEDFPFLILVSIFLYLIAFDGKIEIVESIFLVLSLLSYILLSIKNLEKSKEKLNLKTLIIFIISLIGLYIGAELTVNMLLKLSKLLNIGVFNLSAFILALGTSLPELVVSVVSAKKGKIDISIGNVIGSNIFNILGVIGIPGIIGTITVPNLSWYFFMLFLTFALFFILFNREIEKKEALMLLTLYVVYVILLF